MRLKKNKRNKKKKRRRKTKKTIKTRRTIRIIKKTDEKKDEEVKPLQLDLDNCRDRIVRLTVNSSHLGDALLNPEGDVFILSGSF